jgi:hypothetical protein
MKYTSGDPPEELQCEFETVDEVHFFLLLLQNIKFVPQHQWHEKSDKEIGHEERLLIKQRKLVTKLTEATHQHLAALSEPPCISPCPPTNANL